MRIFLRVQTQWRISAIFTGKRALLVKTGLDYAALPIAASALGVALDEAALDAIRVMEDWALKFHRERLTRTA